MSIASLPLRWLIPAAGAVYLGAIFSLVPGAPLGSPRFFGGAAVMVLVYVATLARVWRAPASSPLLLLAFILAVAFRAPLALEPVGPSSDMVRYQWDGRVQLLGYNPYLVVPADPQLAHTHTEQTAKMPSRNARTPYPPAAQLFFRLVVSIRDSTLAMKLALVCCDLLTLLVVWRWLVVTNRNAWLALAYGWNPLVVLEVAHSGHIDALGALWIAASAYWLTRHRTLLATLAFVLAIATKFLPVVLAPLFAGRVRLRDALIGAALLIALYLPFTYGTELPLGAVPNVLANIRFNSPIFHPFAYFVSSTAAAALALLLGLAAAVWVRWRTSVIDPAAWAWPMALALLCAPVIYPWYLLYLTPFLFTTITLPILAWTLSVLPVYIVWHRALEGHVWMVPLPVMFLQYGVFLAACAAVALVWRRSRLSDERVPSSRPPLHSA